MINIEKDLENANGLGITNLEVSIQLKELGFNQPTEYFWRNKDLLFLPAGLGRVKFCKRKMNHNRYDDFIFSAPTQKEADKWLIKNGFKQ